MRRLLRSKSAVRKLLFGLLCAGLLSFGLACNNDGDDGDKDTGMMEEDTGDMEPDTGDDDDDDTGVMDTGTMDTGTDTGQPDTAEDTGGEMDADMGTGPTANVYVIHNSPDQTAGTVDVYANGSKAVDNLEFGFGVPFAELPAGDTTIAIAPEDSSDASNALLEKTVTLEEDSNYIAIATGVADPSNAVENPDGEDIALDLKVKGMAKTSPDGSQSQAVVFHGVTDAPSVNLSINLGAKSAQGLTYGNYTGSYLTLPNGIATIDVTTAADGNFVGSFQTPQLQGNQAYIIVASGFLSPGGDNPGIEPLGLRAFPSQPSGSGPTVEGTELKAPGKIQAVHVAPEGELDPAGIFVGGNQLTKVAYEQATPFISVPAGPDLDIGVGPDGAGSPSVTKTVSFSNGQSKVFVAAGVTDPSGWSVSSANFDLYQGEASAFTVASGMVASNTFHGSFGAPAIDICTKTDNPLVAGLSFGNFNGVTTNTPSTVTVDVFAAASTPCSQDDGNAVATLEVDTTQLGGRYFTNVASGFLDPTNQSGGDSGDKSDSALKVLNVLPDGTVNALQPPSN